MEQAKQKRIFAILLPVWTSFILYSSLTPGEELPPLGWLTLIPYFDKLVHFGFYFGETMILLLCFTPKLRILLIITATILLFSGAIEVIQPLTERSSDLFDMLSNAAGVTTALLLFPIVDRWLHTKIALRNPKQSQTRPFSQKK